MAIAVTDRIRRGEGGVSPFAVAWQDDLKIAFVTVADITARDAIYEWKRLPYMTVYVIATNTEYTLGTDLTIAGQVWTEKTYGVPANVVTEDEIFDSEGYIQPQLIKNIFLNTSYVVANEAAMLALTTYTGNFVIRTDTSEVYIKLNNDNPADISDFALASGGSGVISVNGSTGVVSVTIASLLAVGANQTAFDAAVTISPTVATNVGAILTIQGDITTLQGDLADLDDYVQTHLGIQALSATAQIPTGGDVGKSLIWNGTNYDLSLISGGGGFADPMTTRGDLIFRNSSNVTDRLAVGTATYVLTSDGTDVSWAAPSSSFTLTDGNGTTVNGTGDGVDLGGTVNSSVFLNYTGSSWILYATATDGDFEGTMNLSASSGGFFAQNSSSGSFSGFAHLNDGGNFYASMSSRSSAANDQTLRVNPTYVDISSNGTDYIGGVLRLRSSGAGASGRYVQIQVPVLPSSYTLTMPVDAGTSGYILSTDGSGVLSWAAPSGGGLTVGTSTITSGTNGYGFYNNSGVLGEFAYGTGVRTWLTTPSWTNFNSAITGTAPFYSLASGGTATGTNTFAMGSNPFILTSGVTTGTGATAGIQNVFNSLTTGNGLDISSSSVSSGAIVKITGTGTAAASQTQSGLVVDVSGANATSTQTTHAGYFSNTKTGTSSTNIAGYFNASGGTNNLAIYAPSGIVTLGSTGAGYNGRLYSTAGTAGRVAVFGNLEITTSVGASWTGTGIQAVGSNRKISFFGGNWGTDNDQVDVSWNSTGVNRSGVDLGIFRSSLGVFGTTLFQANSIAGFRFIDTWPTLTTPLNVVYGFDYSPGGAGNAVSEVAFRAVTGQIVFGATGTSSASDRVKINGIGTTTGKGLVVNNSSGSERFSVQDDGVININGSAGAAGQVLTSNGTSAAAWAAPSIKTSTTKTVTETIVHNIGTIGASSTASSAIRVNSDYGNSTTLIADITVYAIKSDGSASVMGKVTGRYRKNSSGTFSVDDAGTTITSDVTILLSIVPEINGTNPQVQINTGASAANYDFSFTAVCSYITY